MTHDELLARIKQYSDWAEVAFDTSPTNALRAVVELAKETSIIKPYTNYHLGYQTAIKEVIQAIEEELG